MKVFTTLCVALLVFSAVSNASAQEGEELVDTRDPRMQEGTMFYCALDNCYEVVDEEMVATFPADEYPGGEGEKLEPEEGEEPEVFEKVEKSSSDEVVTKACEALLDEYDPEENPDAAAKPIYHRVKRACDTLMEKRADYDFYLDHPKERWTVEPGFARETYKAKSNVYVVVILVVAIACAIDWKMQETRYNDARKQFQKSMDAQVRDRARQNRSGAGGASGDAPTKVGLRKKGSGKKSKEKKKLTEEELEQAAEQLFSEFLKESDQAVVRKPEGFNDLLVVKMLIFPLWAFGVVKGFATNDVVFKTRWKMDMSEKAWAELDEDTQVQFVEDFKSGKMDVAESKERARRVAKDKKKGKKKGR